MEKSVKSCVKELYIFIQEKSFLGGEKVKSNDIYFFKTMPLKTEG